jgi:hypothetical protein
MRELKKCKQNKIFIVHNQVLVLKYTFCGIVLCENESMDWLYFWICCSQRINVWCKTSILLKKNRRGRLLYREKFDEIGHLCITRINQILQKIQFWGFCTLVWTFLNNISKNHEYPIFHLDIIRYGRVVIFVLFLPTHWPTKLHP